MTRIDGASQLAAIIRARLAAAGAQAGTTQSGRDRSSARSGKEASGAAGKDSTPEGSAASPISRLIGQRVAALRNDDGDRHRKAFRIFLESALIQEFGIGMIDDAGFQRVVDEVHSQMEADPDLRDAMGEAAELLLAQAEAKRSAPGL